MNPISVISKYGMYILLAALAASLVYCGMLQLTNSRLQVEVLMYKGQYENAIVVDEMNKNTAAANQLVLQTVINKQNTMFSTLSTLSDEQNAAILAQLKEQQLATNAQYKKVSQAIDGIQIESCQGLMDALVQFPSTGATTWGPVKLKP